MATSSITGVRDATPIPDDDDTRLLGPSSNSDSGSDTLGQRPDLAQPEERFGLSAREPLGGASDAGGTGERADVEGDTFRDNADILPDHIIGPGGGAYDPDRTHEISGALAADEALGEDVDPEDDEDEDA